MKHLKLQGFPNSSKGRGWGNSEIFFGGGGGGGGGNFFTFKFFFSKLKTTFCEYWTLIKIKINMTCVSKEYEIKTKNGARSMAAAKNSVFIWLKLENCCLVGGRFWLLVWGDKNWVVVGVYWGGGAGGDFSRGRNEQVFGWWGRDSPSPSLCPPVGKTLNWVIIWMKFKFIWLL